MDNYFNEIVVLGEKLSQKNKERIKRELDKKMKEVNEKRKDREKDREIFKAKKRTYKTILPMVKRLLSPLVKALKKYYRVTYVIEVEKRMGPAYLRVSWYIYSGPYNLIISLPDRQDCFDLYRENTSHFPDPEVGKQFSDKADLTEDSLRAKIKEVFIDYINLQE